MTIKVNTATLKQKLSHYLALAREGKDVLVTNHRRIIARVLSEEGKDGRLPLRQPTKDASSGLLTNIPVKKPRRPALSANDAA